MAKDRDLTTPLLGSVLASNDAHIQRVVDVVLEKRRQRVALLGLSFKVGSDDLRESPFVRLAEELIGKGVPLRIYDPDVALGDVFGRNRAYVDEHLPHVGQLVAHELDEVLARRRSRDRRQEAARGDAAARRGCARSDRDRPRGRAAS